MTANKKAVKWYRHTTTMGWRKDLSQSYRRSNALRAHNGDLLATARALQALANVTTDGGTRRAAKADAKHFFARYRAKVNR